MDEESPDYGNLPSPQPLPAGWLRRWPLVTFLLPMVVFMLITQLEPTPTSKPTVQEATSTETDEDSLSSLPVEPSKPSEAFIPYRYYPVIYTIKVVFVIAAMIAVWPGYRTFPLKVSPLAFVVGIVGIVLWIALCKLDLEVMLLKPIGLGWLVESGTRSAYNPLEELAENPFWAYGFLVVRFIGLALLVPIFEEFFLRGLAMRFVVDDQFEKVPFGYVTPAALVAGTAIPMLMHTGELVAAFAWFSLVTWLMIRTKNIWDCVVAHAVTNFLLGVYVVKTGEWWFM